MRRKARLGLVLLAAGTLTPALADPLGADGSAVDNERLRPGVYPAAPVPQGFAVPVEPGHPPFEIDWSIGLRGTYTHATDAETFVTRVTPQFSATHDGSLADLVLAGSAELAKPSGQDDVTITNMRLGLSVTMAIDRVTTLSGTAAIGLSKDLPGSPNLQQQVITPPEIVTGTLGLGLDRQFGLFNVGVDVGADRSLYGPTTRRDTGVTDNSAQNRWRLTGDLRVGYQMTPIFEVFTQSGVARDIFDRQGNSGLSSNATNRTLRAGISGSWSNILTASVSAGVGQRVFDAESLGEVTTQLYGASVSFTPDPTWRMTGSLETTMDPPGPDASGTARIQHRALANIDYTVNSWLRLRATADWSHSQLIGSAETEKRFGLGAGADYTVNAHTALTADYGFGRRDNSTTGQSDSHQVSLGITLAR